MLEKWRAIENREKILYCSVLAILLYAIVLLVKNQLFFIIGGTIVYICAFFAGFYGYLTLKEKKLDIPRGVLFALALFSGIGLFGALSAMGRQKEKTKTEKTILWVIIILFILGIIGVLFLTRWV